MVRRFGEFDSILHKFTEFGSHGVFNVSMKYYQRHLEIIVLYPETAGNDGVFRYAKKFDEEVFEEFTYLELCGIFHNLMIIVRDLWWYDVRNAMHDEMYKLHRYMELHKKKAVTDND